MATIHDNEKTQQLVIKTIAKNCTASPPPTTHPIFKQISDALKAGRALQATTLSGGITNFSYKVQVDEQSELCLFAKLSMEYALFNPDAHHDLARAENEFKMMQLMSAKIPDCIVTPLACWNIQVELEDGKIQKGKILLTEWSSADEQLGNQFADGVVDDRVAPQIANTLATLHLMEGYNPEFNQTVKPCFSGLLLMAKGVVEGLCNKEKPNDRTENYCSEIGWDAMLKVMDANIANYDQRDCLIHGDSHIFNMLVEAKPSIEMLEEFGPDGTLILCDWETCTAGPIGKDVGAALAGPIGCLIGHALNNGRAEESIECFIATLLDVYISRMMEAGKTQEETANIIRNAAGWVGWTQFLVFYYLGVQLDAFGVETDELKAYIRDTMGILGIKLMFFSYGTDYDHTSMDAQEMKQIFSSFYKEEIERAILNWSSHKQRMMRRQSSILRQTGRRVSDAALHLLAKDSIARELSSSSIKE